MVEQKKGLKTLTTLLSKTAGLVFFSFLAISLGVVFGLLFEGWVKDQPGTMVGSDSGLLETVDLPVEIIEDEPLEQSRPGNNKTKTQISPTAIIDQPVRYKVRVGPYGDRQAALDVSQQLKSLGYPVYVGNQAPFAVQVGAFGTSGNAERLQEELTQIGYQVFIETE